LCPIPTPSNDTTSIAHASARPLSARLCREPAAIGRILKTIEKSRENAAERVASTLQLRHAHPNQTTLKDCQDESSTNNTNSFRNDASNLIQVDSTQLHRAPTDKYPRAKQHSDLPSRLQSYVDTKANRPGSEARSPSVTRAKGAVATDLFGPHNLGPPPETSKSKSSPIFVPERRIKPAPSRFHTTRSSSDRQASESQASSRVIFLQEPKATHTRKPTDQESEGWNPSVRRAAASRCRRPLAQHNP
jgi:hypothetical protein